jgi:hypothetical protein
MLMGRITLFWNMLLMYPQIALVICLLIMIGSLLSMQIKLPLNRKMALNLLLKSYAISNMGNTLSLLMIYFSVTVGLILSLRMSHLGYNKPLFSLTFNISLMNLIIILCFVILISLLRSVFNKLILKEMYKAYLYLYTINFGKRVIEFLFDRYYDSQQNRYLAKFYLFLIAIQPDKELSFIAIARYEDKESKISLEMIYKLRSVFSQKSFLYFVVKQLSRIVYLLDYYWWPLRYYLIHFILFLTLSYDLIHEVIYYTYYILPIFMLITLYRNLLSFIGTKDFYVLDPMLSAYIYTKQISLSDLLCKEEIIKEYLFNGYRGEHASDNFKEKIPSIEPKFIQIKRFYLLIGIYIINWLLLFHMTIINTLVLTLPLILLVNSIEFNHFIILENKRIFRQFIYFLSIISMLMINFWVYLTRHHYLYFREIILDKGIIINQTFTLDEKKDFLYKYLHYILDNSSSIAEYHKGNILSKITDENLINYLSNDTTIQQIRDYVKNLPLVYLRIEQFYDKKFFEIYHETFFLAQNEMVSPWYTLLKNLLFMGALITTTIYYTRLWAIMQKLQDPYELYRIASEIMSMDPYGRSFFLNRSTVLNFFAKLKLNLPSIADIILLYGLENIPLQVKLIFTGVATALSGTLLLPKFISYLLPPLPTNKPIDTIYVTFLNDMSGIPIIYPYNRYYIMGIGIVLLSVILMKLYFENKKKP